MIAYKAFNKDWTCRDFQYEVGKTYKHEGDISLCRNGFHACLNPLDCWGYYDVTDSKFAVVEVKKPKKNKDGDTKIATAEITIKAELTFPEFIKAGVEYLIDITKGKKQANKKYARIGSSGDYARIGSSGGYARIGSSGGYAQIGSSGNYAQIGSSGNYAQIGSSGDYARIGSSGYSAQIKPEGEKAIIASAGVATKAKAKKGTWISLAEHKNGECVGFASGCIGKKGLKPDTWYEARNGKLQECDI